MQDQFSMHSYPAPPSQSSMYPTSLPPAYANIPPPMAVPALSAAVLNRPIQPSPLSQAYVSSAIRKTAEADDDYDDE
jgi:hypothetical protein